MKTFSVQMTAMIIAQPLTMYEFLRVLQFGFFMSAGLTILVGVLAVRSIDTIQVRLAKGKHKG